MAKAKTTKATTPTPLLEIPIEPFYDLAIVGDTVWCADTAAQAIRGFALDSGTQVASIAVKRFLGFRASATVIATGDNCLTLFDPHGKQLRTLSSGEATSSSTRLEAIDRVGRLGVGHASEDFVAWDLATGDVAHRSPNGYWGVHDIEPGGAHILITRAKKPCVLVDPTTFARRTVPGSEYGGAPVWSPDGHTLVCRGSLRSLVIDVAKATVTHTLKTPHDRDSCFVPGTSLYLQGSNKITVYDTKSWQPIGTVAVRLRSMAVSEDGMHLATVVEGGPIQIWALDRLLEGLAAPKAPKPKAAAKGQPIKGVFFGVPSTVARADLLAAAKSLHYILDRRPPDFAMELALAPVGRDRHWFRFLGSRGRNYTLEPWIECLHADLDVPIDVVCRQLDQVKARRFADGFNGTDIDVPDDYLDAARVTDPILVTAGNETVTRAQIKNLINTVELYYAPSFAGARSKAVPKVRP